MADTYDVNTDTVRGENLCLFLNNGTSDQILAFALTCDINMTAETIDASNKMSGAWKESVAGQLGYTISSECLMTQKTGTLSYDALHDLMVARSKIPFKVATPGTDNAVGTGLRTGSAIITSLDLKTDKGTLCTYTISLQGTGALAKVATGT